MDEHFRRGIESLVAAFLRERMAPALFQRDAVRLALGVERLDQLQRDILARLQQAEREGMEDRARVREAVEAILVTLTGTRSAALMSMLRSWFEDQQSERRDPR